MSYTIDTFVLTAFLGAGFALVYIPCSLYFKNRFRFDVTPDSTHEFTKDTNEFVSQLQMIANDMSRDVSAHSATVTSISDELSHDVEPSLEAVKAAISRIAVTNEHLKDQLNEAKATIEQQAEVIDTQMAHALSDALTGIPNRRVFDHELQRRIAEWKRKKRPFTLMLCDLDHFKQFNDTHGHLAGDEVLRGAAGRMSKSVREMDLIARYGGEEFGIIMPETKTSDAAKVSLRLLHDISDRPFSFDDKQLQVTTSLGMAQVQEGDDENSLIKRADQALYASKNAGRNCVHVHSGTECRKISVVEHSQANGSKKKASPTSQKVDSSEFDSPVAEKPAAESGPRSEISSREVFEKVVQGRLAEIRRYGGRLSMMLLKIDHREEIVARGEGAWNLVTKAAAQFVRAAVRDSDETARFADNQFAVLLTNTACQEAVSPAERLRKAIDSCDKLFHQNKPLRFTVSVGIAEATASEDTAAFLRRVERTVRAASNAGKNCVFIHQDGEPKKAEVVALYDGPTLLDSVVSHESMP